MWAETKPTHPQSSPDFNRTGVGAYRIRPGMSENETMAANTSLSSAVHLRPCGGRMRYAPTVLRYHEMMQKRLEVTSIPNCSLYKTIFTLFNALLFTTQNRHAGVQAPFVHGAKPPCKCSKTDCSLCKTSMQMFHVCLFTIQNSTA